MVYVGQWRLSVVSLYRHAYVQAMVPYFPQHILQNADPDEAFTSSVFINNIITI